MNDGEIAKHLISVNPKLAKQYAECQYPKLQEAGKLMLEFLEEQKRVKGWTRGK